MFDRLVGHAVESRRRLRPHGVAAGRFLIISGGVTPVLKSHIHPEVSARERLALTRDVVKDDCRRRATLVPILRGMIR